MEYFLNFGKNIANWTNSDYQAFRVEKKSQAAFREAAPSKSSSSFLSCLFSSRKLIIFFESSSQRREFIDFRLLRSVIDFTSRKNGSAIWHFSKL